MEPGVHASDEEVRALAGEILSRDPYAVFRELPGGWDAVLDWLEQALGWFDRLRFTEPLLYWLLLFGLLFVALALLAHVVWTVSIAVRTPAPGAAQSDAAAGPDLLARAERAAAGGQFLEAARLVQLATLESLLKRRTIHLSRFEPNRVLRRRLREAPLAEPERRELLRLVDRLERRLFRERLEDPDLYEDWRRLHARVHAGAVAS